MLSSKRFILMNYSAYYPIDVVNGTGTRCTLFVSGCTHFCKGCYNKQTWSFDNGSPFDKNIEDRIIEDLNDQRIVRNGISITGGDPLHPRNIDAVIALIDRIKKECSKDKSIWCWTGYKIEELLDLGEKYIYLLKNVDVIIDGKFVMEKKDPSLPWRGSSNQRIIRVSNIDL